MQLANITKTTLDATAIAAAHNVECLIVVPCYNEEKRLDANAFLQFASENAHIGFVFVDDGSKDKTFAKLVGMKIANPHQIEVVQMTKNSGKAEAVRAGLRHAANTDAVHVGYWDADLATPLDAIDDMHRVAKRYSDLEVIFGSRRMMLGHRINRTLGRLAVSRICSTLARIAIRLPIGDTQCGAKLLRNSPALKSALSQPFTTGWLFDVELFSRMSAMIAAPRKAFYEFPLAGWEEVAGSKISMKAIVKAGFAMLGLIAKTRILGRNDLTASAAFQPASTFTATSHATDMAAGAVNQMPELAA